MKYDIPHSLLILLFLFNINLFCSANKLDSFEDSLLTLNELELIPFYDSSLHLILEFQTIENRRTKSKYSHLLFDKIMSRESEFGNRLSWIHSKALNEDQKIKYINHLESLAISIEDDFLLGWVLLEKGRIYQRNKRHDIAINSILKAKNIFSNQNDSIHISLANFLIGNLFFKAQLNERALDYYWIANEFLVGNSDYINEQKFIILNHITLALIQSNQFEAAVTNLNSTFESYYYFIKPVNKGNALSFLYGLYAEAYFGNNNLSDAESNISKAIETVDSTEFNLKGRYFYIKGKIEFERGQYKQSLESALFALKTFREKAKPIDLIPELYRLLAQNYEFRNEYDKADLYLEKYFDLTKLIEQSANKKQSILLVSEENYKLLNEEFIATKLLNRYSILGLIITLLVLSYIAFLFFKIRRANLKLVRKGLELERIYMISHPKKVSKNGKNLEILVQELDHLMFSDKLFLDKTYSLTKAANILSTNTSYLSEAINKVLNKNFSSYINTYRIGYAIELIKEGEADKITIEALAERSGFNNRSVFNTSFKIYTGVTPSFFIKNYRKQLN